MKAIVPQKSEELFAHSKKKTAPEGFVQMFLINEANAKTEENSTGIKLFQILQFFHDVDKTKLILDEILDGVSNQEKNKSSSKSKKDDMDATVAQRKEAFLSNFKNIYSRIIIWGFSKCFILNKPVWF